MTFPFLFSERWIDFYNEDLFITDLGTLGQLYPSLRVHVVCTYCGLSDIIYPESISGYDFRVAHRHKSQGRLFNKDTSLWPLSTQQITGMTPTRIPSSVRKMLKRR